MSIFICFSDSILSTIPNEVAQLDSLTVMTISGSFKHFPRHLLKIKNLKSLSISSSKLTEIPPDIQKLRNLIELNFWDNNLTVLPDEIGNLKNLEILDVTYNSIKEFPDSIVNLKNLRELHFDNNPAASRQYYVEELKEKMPKCKVMNYTEPQCGNTSR